VKVVVAHNRYVSTRPSGENAVVASDIANLTAAGVEVVEFLRSSDEIGRCPWRNADAAGVTALRGPGPSVNSACPDRPRAADVLHLHNPYPLLSPWVVRTAHAHGVPVVHTVHNYRQTCVNGLHFRDGAPCHDCVGRGCRHRPSATAVTATRARSPPSWPRRSRCTVARGVPLTAFWL
jgi:glycosyltransferase involved in cell wall biosynthesis